MISEKKYAYRINWHNLEKTIKIIQKIFNKSKNERILIINHGLHLFVWFIPALFFTIFFRLFKPWVIIRIKQLRHDRIGHFTSNTEVYLCERDRGINNPNQRFIDIWYYNGDVCNMQLQKMWNRVLKIWPTYISSLIVMINSLMPDSELYTIPWRHAQNRDINNVLELVPPHLSFTQDEEEFGRIKLESMGVLPGSLFICFVGRDSKYLQLTQPNIHFDYHDYRNTDVKKYLLMAEEMANRGYYAIRMGAAVNESLASNNPRIIDYATNGQRSDFMDIFLGAKCHFFISVGTGIDGVPEIFRRPILFVNFPLLEMPPTWNKTHIFIPKKFWLNKEQKFMPFREIIKSGAGRFGQTQQYTNMGITLIENTPEEIRDVTIEMDERLKGSWVTTEEDEDLQRKFWSLYRPNSELHGIIYSRIGAAFLRKYKALLG